MSGASNFNNFRRGKKIRSNIRKAGLVALMGAIIGVGGYGFEKEEPKKEDISPADPVSLEDKLYTQTKIVFTSERDGNFDIYIMNADGSEQKRLTNNPAYDGHPFWLPFLLSEINIRPR